MSLETLLRPLVRGAYRRTAVMRNGGRLTVDPSNVVGARLRIVRGASFDMSHQASCGEDVYVMAAVSCGAATMISGRVSFVGRDHPHKGVVGLMRDEPSLFPADIEIGSDCLIGFGATLVGPLSVGDGAIVGAGAVVSRNVEPREIVVGNPAVTKGHRPQ